MAEILRFQTNLYQEVALKFPEGVQVESAKGYGPQFLFTLAEPPDARMYVAPIAAERIRELGVVPGQRFAIGKIEVQDGLRKKQQWDVKLVDPAPAPIAGKMPVSPATVRQSTQTTHSSNSGHGELALPRVMPAPPASPGTNGTNGHPPLNGSNGHATANGIPYYDPKTELLNAYDDAIDVLVKARDHAAAKGLPIQFTGEDVRCVAATLYIDQGKNRRTPWHPQAA